MELSSRKISKRAIEPVDEWLQNEGYYRKHAPKDPTCLFRAVSEQVYQSQRCHIKVRKECVEFMRKNKNMFEEKISIPFESYLDQMACFTEWGGMNEILALSLLFKKNVIIFHGQKLTKETVIDHEFKDNLFLCFTPPKQYETVYTQEYTANAGFCQSLVYQTLYKNIFKMSNVDVTVHKMLHERNSHLRHDKFFLKGNIEMRNQLTVELLDKIEDGNSEELQLLSKGITPFPYRVAKALDPNIYRNIDYDIWHEIRREVRNSGYTKFNSTELQAGAKCLVQIDLKENDKANNNFLGSRETWDNNSKTTTKLKRLEPLFYTGHIQEMSKNEGPAVVFIEELGSKMTVPYEALKPFPQRKIKQINWSITANKKNLLAQNTKWKKPWNSTGRKLRDQVANENNVEKNQTNNSKSVSKNITCKSEWNTESTLENHFVKQQVESYSSYKEYSPNSTIDNVKSTLENTHISTAEAVEHTIVDPKNKNPINTDISDNTSKKQQTIANFNQDPNQLCKQQIQRIEKNEIFYPPYTSSSYPTNARFPGEPEVINYDLVKNLDVEGNDVPYSDPATARHFFNLGVKYVWTHNMWANGINNQVFGDNSYYMGQHPNDMSLNTNITNGSIPSNSENISETNHTSSNIRHNSRLSPPRHRDQDNSNSTRSSGQKTNYRNSEFRNNTPNIRDLHQSSNIDVNRNRIEYKNSNEQQQQVSSNKEPQRGNKTNGVAPRFKKNYEGKNRNDHHNPQHQHRQHQPDYDSRTKKQMDVQPITNHCEMNDINQIQQQNSLQHQQQQQHQQQHQQQPSLLQSQTPMNNSYPYPVPYNQQVPYIPLSPYPAEADTFPGHYYPPPPGYIQVPYLPPADLPEGASLSAGPCVPPVYPAIDNFSAQYPPVYSQYVYHTPTIYPANQPPGATGSMPDNCYPGPYQSQPYFFPYPPPPNPSINAGNPQIAQAAPAH